MCTCTRQKSSIADITFQQECATVESQSIEVVEDDPEPTSNRLARQGEKPLGMSFACIKKFLEEHKAVEDNKLTTSQVNKQFVKPETKKEQSENQAAIDTKCTNLEMKDNKNAYIYKYVGLPTSGPAYVAPATVFVSHAWSYPFAETVVKVMEEYDKENPNAYFWFDLFTNDQNSVNDKGFDWFCNKFRSSIQSIRDVLLILSPWNAPTTLTRVWCLFEIANTIPSYGALADNPPSGKAMLPAYEIDKLKSGVTENCHCLSDALSNIRAENARATQETDKKNIDKFIQDEVTGGFLALNDQIKKWVRKQYISYLKELVKKHPADHLLRNNVGVVMMKFGHLDEASEYLNSTLEQRTELFNEDSAEVATTLENMGALEYEKDNYGKALDYHMRALAIKKHILGTNHPEIASLFNSIGSVYLKTDQFDEALKYFIPSLSIYKSSDTNFDLSELVLTKNNLGLLYQGQGDYKTALQYYQEASSILSKDHLLSATVFSNMGTLHEKRANFPMAIKCLKKALAIKHQILGEHHTEVAEINSSIGNVYSRKGENVEAGKFYSKAEPLSVYKTSSAAEYYNDLGVQCNREKRYDEALDHHKESLEIRLEIFGKNHSAVAISFNNLGLVYSNKRDYKEAIKCYETALEIKKRVYGTRHLRHSSVAITYHNLGLACFEQGYLIKARRYYLKALEIKEALKDDVDPLSLANTQYELGKISYMNSEYEESIEYFSKALVIKVNKLGEDHPDIKEIKDLLRMVTCKCGCCLKTGFILSRCLCCC